MSETTGAYLDPEESSEGSDRGNSSRKVSPEIHEGAEPVWLGDAGPSRSQSKSKSRASAGTGTVVTVLCVTRVSDKSVAECATGGPWATNEGAVCCSSHVWM